MIKIGDLVQVNHWCDAGGLWDLYGVVISFKSIMNKDCARVRLFSAHTRSRPHLIPISALDLINQRGDTNVENV